MRLPCCSRSVRSPGISLPGRPDAGHAHPAACCRSFFLPSSSSSSASPAANQPTFRARKVCDDDCVPPPRVGGRGRLDWTLQSPRKMILGGREGMEREGSWPGAHPVPAPCKQLPQLSPSPLPPVSPQPVMSSSVGRRMQENLGGVFCHAFWIPLAFATLSSSCAPFLLSRENLCLPGEEQIEFPNPRARAGCSLLPCSLSARFPLPPRTPAWGKPWWLCTAGAPLGATARRTGSQRCPRGRLHYLLALS